jgi:hypothetical protein
MVEYCYCFILFLICNVESGEASMEELQKSLDKSAEMIKNIQKCKMAKQLIIPTEIMKSYWYYLNGKFFLRFGRDLEAYEKFILALNEEHFDPHIHRKVKAEIEKLVTKYGMDASIIEPMFHHVSESPEAESQREFILISDTSNPDMKGNEVSEWKTKARRMATYIFDNHMKGRDRIGISEFCHEVKVVCNLIEKGTSTNMLRKEVKAAIKVRGQVVYSQLVPNVQKVVERTKNLKKEKVFLFFLKRGEEVDSEDILREIDKAENSIFIFLVLGTNERIKQTHEGFYIVDFQSFNDVDIILGDKKVRKADNIIYLF